MKANELMIGDWVKFPIGNDKVVDLPYIEGRGICASFTASATLFPVEVYKIEPIPLTPEILKKNGFELTGVLKNIYSDGDSNYTITINKNGRGQCDIMNHLFHIGVTMECCGSVHQLQHALKLCGIDKEIVI